MVQSRLPDNPELQAAIAMSLDTAYAQEHRGGRHGARTRDLTETGVPATPDTGARARKKRGSKR